MHLLGVLSGSATTVPMALDSGRALHLGTVGARQRIAPVGLRFGREGRQEREAEGGCGGRAETSRVAASALGEGGSIRTAVRD